MEAEEETCELAGDVREGVPGEFEPTAIAEDDDEEIGWGRGEVDLDEGGGRGTTAIGVEGRDGELMGGAEGGAGLATGLVSGEKLLNCNGSAAVNC